ncbi:MAG: hypothetical protein ACKO3N_04530, partial [Verrucomicrobiota bacterium]
RIARPAGGWSRALRPFLPWIGVAGVTLAAVLHARHGRKPRPAAFDPSDGPGETWGLAPAEPALAQPLQLAIAKPGGPGVDVATGKRGAGTGLWTGPGDAVAPVAEEMAEMAGDGHDAGEADEEETPAQQAASFAESDPAAGLAWAGRLPTDDERQAAFENLAWACAGRNREVAVEALEQLPADEARWRLAAHVASQWAAAQADDAERWADARPNPFERDAALSAVAIAVAEAQPMRAATLVARKLPAGPGRDHAVVAVVQRWAQTDRAGAERWVSAFGDRPLQAVAWAAIQSVAPPADQAP